jgi:HEAT repeat protein
MCNAFYWVFPFKGRVETKAEERTSTETEARGAEAPSVYRRVEQPAPLTNYFEALIRPRVTTPATVKETTKAHIAPAGKTKDLEYGSSLESIEFSSKLERLKAETYAADFKSMDKEVRAKALDQIKKLSEISAINVLKKLLLSSREPLQTIEIISALGEINNKGLLDKRVFVDFLRDQNPSVRQAALRGLAKYRDDDSFSYVSESLQDTEAEVRRQALNCLAWFFGDRCAQAVAKSMHDIDAGVRKSAALMSGSMKLSQSISGLITLLSDSDQGVQKAASDSLRKITGQDYGFRVNGSAKSKSEAIEGWRFWWRDNQSKFVSGKK